MINSSFDLRKVKARLSKEMIAHNDFWMSGKGTYKQRSKELKHQRLAFKIWNLINENKADKKYRTVSEICSELNTHKISVMLILRKWIRLKLIERRRIGKSCYDRTIDFHIKLRGSILPYLLYTNFKNRKPKKFSEKSK